MSLFDASAQRAHAQTLMLLALLALSSAGNVMAIWWYGGRVMHYIPVSATGEMGPAQESRPGEFPVAIQVHGARLVVQTLGNVTPESLTAAIQTVRPYLEPAAYVALHSQGEAEAATMRVADVSIMTTNVTLSGVQTLNRRERTNATRLKFSAVRHLFSYGMALEPHTITVVVEVTPPPVASGTSDTLRVTHLAWPPLKIKDGDFQDFTFTQEAARQVRPRRRGVTR